MQQHQELSFNQRDSFLWAYHFSAGIGKPIDPKALKNQDGAPGFFWIHLQSDSSDAEQTMEELGLSKSVADSLLALETRPKTLPLEGGLVVYLRGINTNPEADPEDMVSLRLWLTDSGIVSTRRRDRKLYSVQDVKNDIDQGTKVASIGDLLLEIIERVVDRISEMVDILDEELVDFETSEAMDVKARQRLSVVRRQAASIRRYLAPQRDALDALYRSNKYLSQDQAFTLREQIDRTIRYVEDLDLARERAIVLQDEVRNRIADRQGMVMYVLSLVTAIFLPLSFLTGVFGMNVGGLPGIDNPEAFNLLTLAMLGVAVLLGGFMLWKRWF
ncbi:zinc transporter ZntB [Paraglaciecola chathamensis]|jgi:zinc transporter|uniref:Zinc transport protein zntB n=1 Tax=Paraglaciecola chathamensis S18K6 TaxID=1127672 RepID=A0AAV3UU91_9ALTE|nr:zinc transporter ZntB [Paraglaciecola chathamensis]GAC08601.1 zinc transport protein zntB [Paraglaciecola chathamensis S18K6]